MNSLLITRAVEAALLEDLGRAGDITSQAIIPMTARAQAVAAARAPGVVAGIELAVATFHTLDISAKIEPLLLDGARVQAGDILLRVEAQAQALLAAERVALNFLGHLSGVATLTADYAARVAHTSARITCTRKTTPGLRAFEKHAVSMGGGSNHRFGLDDAILIKDNHIAVAGGVGPALKAAKRAAGHLVKIEIEVDTLAQLDEVLAAGADCVLLDNMDVATLREAVRRIRSQRPAMQAEASGGVRLDTVAAIAETGVDLIAVGGLTHSAPCLDIGLDIEI